MKMWKKICLCIALLISVFSFSACSCSKQEIVAVDLDGDGIVENWEEFFESAGRSCIEYPGMEVVEISDVNDLKAINKKTDKTYVYKLVNSIDCGGEKLSINLANSILLGDNRVIGNFKLDKCKYDTKDNEIDANVYGLFYNGLAIHDLRLFMGYQKIVVKELKSRIVISPLINTQYIDVVNVKGKIEVNRKDVAGLNSGNTLDASLVYARFEDPTIYVEKETQINHVNVQGELVYGGDSDTNVRLGGVAPYLNKSSTLYNSMIDVQFKTNVNLRMYMGGIVGENEGFISQCNSYGQMNTSYTSSVQNDTPKYDYVVGGIVGFNSVDGEMKNVTSNMTIKFDKKLANKSDDSNYSVGGIVGSTNGIISYAVNDAELILDNVANVNAGGIAGTSNEAIFSNIICRGSIQCKNVNVLYVADMVGYSQYGYMESCVVLTNITVDNSAINSVVYSGLLTIFEDLKQNAEIKYNALYSPYFKGVLVAGKTVVTMKPTGDANRFRYNLGLRNPYENFKFDSDGNIQTEIVEKEVDGEMQEVEVNLTEVITPDIFNNLNILDTYSLTKFTKGADDTPKSETLTFTYPKNKITVNRSSSMISVNFFVAELGFKYGLNHNEINLGASIDLNKIRFTLSSEKSETRYFETKYYNGDLAYYDRYMDSECNLLDIKKNEMASLINDLVVSNTTSVYYPIKISINFAASNYDATESSTMPTIYNMFERNVVQVIEELYQINLTDNVSYLNDSKKPWNEGDDNKVRYIKIDFKDSVNNAGYSFLFDIRQMADDEMMDSYIVFMQYKRSSFLG